MKTANISVECIDYCGSDLSVVNAARVSFNKESERVDIPNVFSISNKCLSEKDIKLINYLAKHNHKSPFNHAFLSFRVKAPLFVARQLGKHEYLPWNEVSRRYVDEEVELYFPDFWRKKAENVKQGSSNLEIKPNTYGNGICVKCGNDVPRKSAGPRGKWCSDACRASYRKEHDPDHRLHTAKFNAQKRALSFNLNRGDIEWVTHCPILGIELEYNSYESSNDNSPSIDRINPLIGYEKDNVWVISNKANRMKNDASKEDLVKFARSILLTFNGQIVPENGDVYSSCEHMVKHYEWLLKEGVAPEQARMVLPQNMMTSWIWSGTLFAFVKMLKLRLDPHTQQETQEVAKQISKYVEMFFPASYQALMENK